MKLPASLSVMLSKLFVTLFSTTQFATVPSPPVITISPPTSNVAPARNMLVQFVAESGKCSDETLDTAAFLKSNVALIPVRPNDPPNNVDIEFRIDENGRALGVTKTGADKFASWTSDIAPAVAASRFTPGKSRFGCTVKYVPHISEIADAPLNTVFEYSIFPNMGNQRPIFDRLKPDGATCFNSAPAVLTRAYPDFTKIPATPGQTDWSMTQFDIDASGKPVNLRTVGGTGSNALDKTSRDAIARSEFAKEPKTGCLYPYRRVAGTLAAPEFPEEDAFRSENANCPKDIIWATHHPATYPVRFRKRYIEGWAIIVFDVAPWGSTGNVRIAAAEPAADFGVAAKQVVELRKVKDPGQGFTGCVERVVFKMGKPQPPSEGEGI